jgi:two-component system phosphate regulon sensor histidine kinase PhoR
VKKGKFKAIIYLISFTVLLTVGIQVYRNVQNYNLNKQRFINDVQVALDIAVESYSAEQAKKDILFLFGDNSSDKGKGTRSISINRTGPTDSMKFKTFAYANSMDLKIDTLPEGSFEGKHWISKHLSDSLPNPNSIQSIEVFTGGDSSKLRNGFEALTTKIALSLVRDSINFEILNKYMAKELERKQIKIEYAFVQLHQDSTLSQSTDFSQSNLPLSIVSKSTYLPKDQQLQLSFSNASAIILKRGLADLFISLLISVTVIGSLLYLYRIINEQKALAEIKNDLISNITHEFKTPIATVNSALEGIANFNQQNDQEKTAKYLDISVGQLKKLNLMVEKLLETATLESEALEIRKEPINLSQILHTLLEKYKMVAGDKEIIFHEHAQDVIIEADPFHIENALSNLIDNAIKYGGDKIEISLAHSNGKAQVVVNDNGGFIEKSQKERVFDKFYRIPTGNQHDVKGFGIGLYYTKKIIEKHGGSIQLVLKPQLTSFEVAIS